jgi:hypothetical protein
MSMWGERAARMKLEVQMGEQQIASLEQLRQLLPQMKQRLAETEAKAKEVGRAMLAKYGIGTTDTIDTSTGAITRKPAEPEPGAPAV